jgi:uncharacterized membrane protein YraQ (UPF0718 family)
MVSLNTIILIGIALVALLISAWKDKKKTKQSLKMAKGLFFKTGIEIVGILALIGLFLAWVPPHIITKILGSGSVALSGLLGAIIGSVTILPAFVAFPLAASLYQRGAYLIAIAAFLTTLTMVGFATLPIETKHFGKKFAYIRNGLSFGLALLIALGMVIIL